MTGTGIFKVFFNAGTLLRMVCIFCVLSAVSGLRELSAQLPAPLDWNTGANVPVGSPDANWFVAHGDTTQATSAFVPALVVGKCDASWPSSAPPAADWISYDFGDDCHHVSNGCIDLYFKREIALPATNECGISISKSFCLDLNLWADNSVYRVSVNGTVNFQYYDALNPYNYNGVQALENLSLCEGWVPGPNTLLIHTRSCPPVAGLLAIAQPRSIIPEDFLGKNVIVCSGESSVTLSGPSDSTIWFDGTVAKTKTVTESGDYWAKIIDPEGCETWDTISVRFSLENFVPNIFSPNDDGKNDCLSASFSEINFDAFEFNIFDRWGNLVFRTENPTDCWDGKNKGKPCAPGVYTYFISIKNGLCDPAILKGDLTLIR